MNAIKDDSELKLSVKLDDFAKEEFYVIMARINGAKYCSRFWVK